jgi:hypothetical protein
MPSTLLGNRLCCPLPPMALHLRHPSDFHQDCGSAKPLNRRPKMWKVKPRRAKRLEGH